MPNSITKNKRFIARSLYCLAIYPLAFLAILLSFIVIVEALQIRTNTIGIMGLTRLSLMVLFPIFAAAIMLLSASLFPWLAQRGLLIPSNLMLLGFAFSLLTTACVKLSLGDWKAPSAEDMLFVGGPVLAYFCAYSIYVGKLGKPESGDDA